jgi:hypothetical protein
MIVRPRRELADLRRCRSLGHYADEVVGHLQEPTLHRESPRPTAAANPELPATEQRNHRCMSSQNAKLPIKRWRDHRLRVALEQHRLRRDYRDFEHAKPRQL